MIPCNEVETTPTVTTTTPDNGELTTCGSNVAAENVEICGALKWHCHDPGAQDIVDLTDTSCHGDQWGTVGCCYGDGGGTSCDRDELMADGDEIFNDWYAATGDCSGTASQMFNSPQMCVAKDSIDNVSYCGKLKWYCHDPFAQDILNMSNHVCHGNQWETVGCCYGVDNGASCDRDALLQDATDIADYWYTTKQQCNNNDWDLVDRNIATTTTPESTTTPDDSLWVVGETEVFTDDFSDPASLATNWNVEVVPNPHNNEYQYYTDRAENVRIEEGKLILTAKKETFEHRQYTSGRVYSKYSFRYGRIEVVAKTPKGRGLWPAIWLLPTENVHGTWPGSGEIDIFEGRGQDQGSPFSICNISVRREKWPNGYRVLALTLKHICRQMILTLPPTRVNCQTIFLS